MVNMGLSMWLFYTFNCKYTNLILFGQKRTAQSSSDRQIWGIAFTLPLNRLSFPNESPLLCKESAFRFLMARR
jgi:hypothetical protein